MTKSSRSRKQLTLTLLGNDYANTQINNGCKGKLPLIVGGVGRLPIENPFYQCKTCNGTGNSKVVWTEPIEVPERYYVHMALG